MKLDYQNYSTRIFEGFYESNLFNSDTEYCLNGMYNDEKNAGTYEIDFEPYCNSITEYATELLKDFCINDDNIVKDIKFMSLYSPKYYNFDTDRLNLEIDFNLSNLKKFIKTNKDDFNTYLKDNFTSYDGFMSFIDNNYNDFMNTFKINTYEKNRCLNVMIEYYILTCIYQSNWEQLTKKYWNDTEYHQSLYDVVLEAQFNYAAL